MTTAFVLSGGGSLGAVQVGMLQALGARGVHPDLLVGTSAGAVNAAWVAANGMSRSSLAELAALWTSLRRSDLFRLDGPRALLAAAGRRSSLFSPAGLRSLVDGHLRITRMSEAVVPLHVVATDLLTGEAVLLSEGDIGDAVLASAAIPGVFPPVTVDGRPLVDGSVGQHAAVSQAVDLGADVVYVLPGGYPCALAQPPASALGVAVQALTLLIEQRLIGEVARFAGAATIRVLPPLCPLAVSSTDFSQAATLISRGRRAADDWLAAGAENLPGQEQFLSLHGHRDRHRPDPPVGSIPGRAAG